MRSRVKKKKVRKYYDQEARNYIQMYKGDYVKYPANLIRLKLIVRRLKETKVNSILDVGCGTCGPMIRLLKEGFKVRGLDFSIKMVEEGKSELKKSGFSPNLIALGDVENHSTLPKEKFDAIIAMGVFPHIPNEKKALLYICKKLKKGGKAFIEFRNDLFAAFTLNKYSRDFFLKRIVNLRSLPQEIKKEVINFYHRRLRVDRAGIRERGKINYNDIFSKFHNPLNIAGELFEPNHFHVDRIHFYHYHALPPIFEQKHKSLFRRLSLEMEDPDSWRGYLMASAFIVEANKK